MHSSWWWGCECPLIVVPGHGDNTKRREIIRNNTRMIPFDRFDCVVFVYAESERLGEWSNGRKAKNFDLGHCKVVLRRGSWIDFQMMLKPVILKAAGYSTITLMLDDVLIAPPNLVAVGSNEYLFDIMTRQLDVHNLSAVSPNIIASPHPQMSSGLGPLDKSARPPRLVVRRHPKGYIGVSFIEIQLIAFRMTANGWPCYYSLLETLSQMQNHGGMMCAIPYSAVQASG